MNPIGKNHIDVISYILLCLPKKMSMGKARKLTYKNSMLEGIYGMKSNTAERRLREIREYYRAETKNDMEINHKENEWTFNEDFRPFIRNLKNAWQKARLERIKEKIKVANTSK